MPLPKIRAAVCFVVLVIATTSAAHATCTNTNFKGAYGIVFNGLNGQGQPTTGLFQVTSNGAGSLTGSANQSTDGTIEEDIAFTGTYSMSKTCSGAATLSIDPPGAYNFILDNGGVGSYWINTDSGKTRAGYAVAQGNATCTDLGVKHVYAVEATGLIVGTGDVVYVGQLSLNGAGSISGILSTSFNGTVTSDAVVGGTYSINSNCTGTASITPKGSTAMNFVLLVVDAGKQLMLMQTDSGSVVSGLAQE